MKWKIPYLAGAMDSDGCFSIKKSTYHVRVRKDSVNPVYSERAMLKQVTPQIPSLLHQFFGGRLAIEEPSCKKNGKPLWSWQCSDKQASAVCEALLPYLQVKKRQAEVLLELRKSKGQPFLKMAYWFELENPNWRDEELIGTAEAMRLLGYARTGSLSQALHNGSIVAIPYDHTGRAKPRYPKKLIEGFASRPGAAEHRTGSCRPPQLIAWRERLWAEVRELNKIGLHGTSTYHRTGHHKPA